MNERIKELIKQVQDADDAIHYYDPVFIEKLTELIVKDIHASLREQWYKENDKVVDTDDKRAVAIHVGVKNGLMTACNTVFTKYIDGKK